MTQPPDDLPKDAGRRLEQLEHGLFTSDLSVNEFLLIKEVGFHPLGFVMGSSIYHTGIQTWSWAKSQELTKLTEAMYNARELAMTRMEEEADELGADGVVGVRLDVNYYEWGSDAAEFIAMGTAVKAESGVSHRNAQGKPFTSDLSGQDFWTIMQTGHVPQGLVMGNCVYHIAHRGIGQALGSVGRNVELPNFTQALYEARELAMTRMQDEANELQASGIVGVRLEEKSHQWGSHTIEFLAIGTAVTRSDGEVTLPRPTTIISLDNLTVGEGDSPVPASALEPDADAHAGVPEAADRRLRSGSFSSGLTVPDFAACLQMGMEPVALVQGYCVMRWGWYGAGSPYMRGVGPYATGSGSYVSNYRCPHGFVGSDHRTWGQNYEQTWVEEAWAEGFGSAYQRMLDEATEAGAHGIVGVTDTTRNLGDLGVTEFHIVGTAVVVRDGDPPPGGVPWTTYLAGQRLAKLFEAGFMPVSVAATLSSVRVWAYCMTEYLMEGGSLMWAGSNVEEADQVVDAHMASYQVAREHVRGQLGGDQLHGARMRVQRRNLGAGDEVVECQLVGTRVRRFKDFDPVAPPVPTVRLS